LRNEPQPPRPMERPKASFDGDNVKETLKTLLANELQIRESDLDERAQFVDLGLDSITGVTWIRKINQTYQTSIEATKVYSYPTLTQLSRYVKEEAEKHGTLPTTGPATRTERPHTSTTSEVRRSKVKARAAQTKLNSRRD